MSLVSDVEQLLELAHTATAEAIEEAEELNEEECATIVHGLRKTGHQDFGDFLALRWELPEE